MVTADNETNDQASTSGLRVVGVGASAGGFEACRALVSTIQDDDEIAWVIVQHLDPTHRSMLAELLQAHAPVPVLEAGPGMAVAGGRVYIAPPGHVLTIVDGCFRLQAFGSGQKPYRTIDSFLISLAEWAGERAIAVILSGSGTDGTHGMLRVKQAGGLTIVQSPEAAGFASMPASALESGGCDQVLMAREIPACIDRHCSGNDQRTAADGDDAEAAIAVERILRIIQSRSGWDFHPYKRSTLRRRIERRRDLAQCSSNETYGDLLEQDLDEVQALRRDLLIGVTAFFREPETWEALRTTVLPSLIADHDDARPIRVWVPGCSTGEEAYTLAIILREAIAASGRALELQLFATDIDEQSLQIARTGRYGLAQVAEIDAAVLERWFVPEGDGFRASDDLREGMIFSRQNLLADPPFSRIDLLSCRNLLIYIDTAVQKRLLRIFHFALQSSGHLILGQAETVGHGSTLFRPVPSCRQIFSRVDNPSPNELTFPLVRSSTTLEQAMQPNELSPRRQDAIPPVVERYLIDAFGPPAVLISDSHQILYYFGDCTPFLAQRSGSPSINILELARDGIGSRLRGALHKVATSGERCTVTLDRRLDEQTVRLGVTVIPFGQPPAPKGAMLILFQEQPVSDALSQLSMDALPDDSLLKHLESELRDTREDLRSTIEALEVSNEELKASNEEVMSMNEELQSSNEELETSKEELQSLNEELSNVNAQLQEKVTHLEAANADLTNFIASTDVAIIFLDAELRIRRFTPAAQSIFSMIDSDVGRQIDDIVCRIEDPTLRQDLVSVRDGGAPTAAMLEPGDGRSLQRRILPYRRADQQIDGLSVVYDDITAVQRANRAAENARHRLRAAIDAAQIGVWTWHLEDDLVSWDGSHAEIFCRRRTRDGYFAPAFDVIDAEDRIQVEEAIAMAREHHLPYRAEFRVADPAGVTRWMSSRGRFDYDDNGVPVRLIGATIDITDRRDADARVAESEQRFRLAFDNANVGICIVDLAGRLQRVNDVFCRIFGLPRAAMEGHQIAEFTDDSDADVSAAFIAAALAGEQDVGHFEKRYRHADGSLIWGEVSSTLVRNAAGDPQYFISHVQDITERKRMMEHLKRREAELRHTQERAHIGSWAWDIESGRVEWSPEMFAIYGVDPAAFSGNLADIVEHQVHPDDRALVMATNESVLNGQPFPVEYRVIWPDGSERLVWAEGHTLETNDAGQPVRLIGFAQDITERRKDEERIRHMQKMDAIGQLAGGIAHDFNNQLTGIMGFANLLERRIKDPSLQHFVQNISVAAHRSSDLTQKLLAFARKGQYRTAVVNMHALVNETAMMLSHTIDKRIVIQQLLTAGDAKVSGDPSQLQNMLLNLGLNARDAMPEGGTLTFRTETVAALPGDKRMFNGEIPALPCLLVEVGDDGSGMDQDVVERAFEPFFTTKAADKGTGMGLAAAYGTVQSHHGAIGIVSEPGVGTTVRFLLPLVQQEASGGQSPEAQMPSRALRILVVDDEDLVRNMLDQILSEQQHQVEMVVNGKEAVDAVRDHGDELDLVILDMIMPIMNGPDCFAALKRLRPELPVLISSGYSINSQAEQLLRDGARGFVQKPYEASDLLTAIAKAIDG